MIDTKCFYAYSSVFPSNLNFNNLVFSKILFYHAFTSFLQLLTNAFKCSRCINGVNSKVELEMVTGILAKKPETETETH